MTRLRALSGCAAWPALVVMAVLLVGCASDARRHDSPSDEIVVCGRRYSVGAPVVLWTDPGGYDAYRTEPRFANAERPGSASSPLITYGERRASDAEVERGVRARGWTLETLRGQVDQIVVHYDAAGTSRGCFRILHDVRGLSAHFLIDIDGTIYQTLDVRERAWHATIANDRSVGIEIANIGAFPVSAAGALGRWYSRDARGTVITLPPDVGGGGVRRPGPFRPAREGPIAGTIQGQRLVMQDFTAEQYEALARLTAVLCKVLPRIECECPRDGAGTPVSGVLSAEAFAKFRGVLGHYHVQENKVDPGPAFDWNRVIGGARATKRGR